MCLVGLLAAKSSTKGPKSHICFAPKAAFTLVPEAVLSMLSLALGSENHPPTTNEDTCSFFLSSVSFDTSLSHNLCLPMVADAAAPTLPVHLVVVLAIPSNGVIPS